MEDHFTVSQFLKDLRIQDIITLGEALGLGISTLQKMTNLPSDMVLAWLLKQDNVLTFSGEPTVQHLVAALNKIGQHGIASTVTQRYISRYYDI